MEFHLVNVSILIKILNTDSSTGLSSAQAQERLQYYGLNKCHTINPFSWFRYTIKQAIYWMPYLLVISGFLWMHTHLFFLLFSSGLLLFGSIAWLCVLCLKRLHQLHAVLMESDDSECLVLRNNQHATLNQHFLVPGDIVLLAPGEYVPADARIIESHSLKVDEFEITGIVGAMVKDCDIVEDEARIWDHTNMVYKSSFIFSGTAKVVVVATGNNSQKIKWGKAQVDGIYTKLLEKKIRLLHNFFYKIGLLSIVGTGLSSYRHTFLCEINYYLCCFLVFVPFISFLWICYRWEKNIKSTTHASLIKTH